MKVLIVDDEEMIRDVIRRYVEFEGNEAYEAEDGMDAVRLCKENDYDVVLMDIRMPNMNGVVATQRIKSEYPSVKVVVLTTFDDSDYILNAINNGASGYLLKDIGSTALIDAVKNAYVGDTILPAKIAKRIADAAMTVSNDREFRLKKAFGLSDREVEIALMIYEGFTNRQIASALHLSEGTARNYISTIYEKMRCENRAEALQKIKNEI